MSSNQARHDHVETGTTVGFLTDVSLCIGCKACEVACKEWNQVPAEPGCFRGYDNTAALGAATWRHVQFLERDQRLGAQVAGPMTGADGEAPFSWLFHSDVCRHCEVAGCLEYCPTGAIVRVETGAVVVQDDVCNGCGYCVVGCPFGVIDRREDPLPGAGGAYKCTFCYDRQKDGLTPACAKACPTESIQFGPLDDLRARAAERAEVLRARGLDDVTVYDPRGTSVGGVHAISLLVGAPEAYGLPARPEVPLVLQRASWTTAALAGAAAVVLTLGAFRL
ncbi:MAG: 4Fe-4S dicluster domain-containing protein [Planctomycetes bacterium]|nr:4Fe-4S dicluster domain-containing protein [Planctomycetota bacterium]